MEELLSNILTALQRLSGSARAPSHTPPVDQHVRSAGTLTVEHLANPIAALVYLHGSPSCEARREAWENLRDMKDDDDKAAGVAAARAIPALVWLLRSRSSPGVQESAALTLCDLVHLPGNQAALVAAGATPALVPLMGPGSSDDVELLESDKPDICAMQDAAASALGHLADGYAQNQTAIAAAGAIPALVQLLQDTDTFYGATEALVGLAEGHAENQTAIAAAGAIPALPAAPLRPLKASIAGKAFAITGTLQGHVRSEFKEHLENTGASVV
ncbi:hypothetical protein FOA52_003165 [Chlamydomonas sp. UWO 241]|nr:hypothetical protein FOA52_003165 [Chlamydomonas sp. UWO 241]